MINNRGAAFSSPELACSSHDQDVSFEAIAANVKLLLKLIHEQSQARNGDLDDRRTQRVAGMITILDDVKTRIQKYSQPVGGTVKEFRRCNTELRPIRAPRDKRSPDVVVDEKEKLRRELQASSTARKSLEAMCSSLGKEKKIMASELSRKVQEVSGMEELINDLKAQNETLLAKVQTCAQEHREKRYGGEAQGEVVNAALQERNKALSEQLLKSLDVYRSLKRKYKDENEENLRIQATMEEIGVEVTEGLGRIHGLKQQLERMEEVQRSDMEKEISALECMFQSFNMKISKHKQKKSTAN
ncbi:hypothetical protein PTKIN_Ptkin02bG0251700 [Pterospermum kingtungense]